MNITALKETAKQMVLAGKGILAADESAGTCKKRFDSVNVPCTEDNRRDYRQTLFTTAGLEQYISGVILHDETIRQKSTEGKMLAEILSEKGIMPGIKVDGGTKDLALHGEEKITEGLDGLRARPLCGALPGSRYRADDRAGSLDRRRTCPRTMLRDNGNNA